MDRITYHHGHFSEMGCFANRRRIHGNITCRQWRKHYADPPSVMTGNGAPFTCDGIPNSNSSINYKPNPNGYDRSDGNHSPNDCKNDENPNSNGCKTDVNPNPNDCNDDKNISPKPNFSETDGNLNLNANDCENHGSSNPNHNAGNWEMLSFEEALACLESYGDDLPSVEDLVCILQKCRKKRNPKYARHIHMHLLKHGMESHRVIGNHLVPMLVECGCLSEARALFDRLLFRNEHSWTSLIQGYNDSGFSQNAFSLLERMQENGVKPSRHTYVALLKACAKLKELEVGQNLHTEIIKENLENDMFIGNILVDMYAKCGSLLDAQKVFDMLQIRDVVSWTALLGGYAEHGLGHHALLCLEKMRSQHVDFNDVTLICGLKACASIAKLDKGQELHAEIVKEGYEKDPYVCNALVDMYARCGLLLEARDLFDDDLPDRDEVSWNSIISGYVEHGLGNDALSCYDEMKKAAKTPNMVTFLCVLKACGIIKALDKGKEIHAEIDKEGYGQDLSVSNALIDMYCRCGLVSEAQKVFDKMPVRDVISWTTLMVSFSEKGHSKDMLTCLEKMRNEGIHPDSVTYLTLLKCCSNRGSIDINIGREIHAEIDKQGYGRDIAVGNSLIHMYTKCGSLEGAVEAFQKMPNKNVVTWTTLLSGYAEQGRGEEALMLFEQMKQEGVSPNDVTFVCSLKACATIKAIYKGQQIHYDIVIEGLERDLFIGNSLIDMYAKCGLLSDAQAIFDEMPSQDTISGTSLIAGYVDCGFIEDAQNMFEQMQMEGIFTEAVSWGPLLMGHAEKGSSDITFDLYGKMMNQGLLPNRVTFMSVLKACTHEGEGKKIHAQIYKKDKHTDIALSNNLIDMYCRVGNIGHAQEVFDEMHTRDHVTWTALMKGYMMKKESKHVLHLFEKMREEGVRPDGITFLIVLNACKYAKLVKKGQKFFEMMSKDYGINPSIEHKNYMADLLRESGKIDDAVEILL